MRAEANNSFARVFNPHIYIVIHRKTGVCVSTEFGTKLATSIDMQ